MLRKVGPCISDTLTTFNSFWWIAKICALCIYNQKIRQRRASLTEEAREREKKKVEKQVEIAFQICFTIFIMQTLLAHKVDNGQNVQPLRFFSWCVCVQCMLLSKLARENGKKIKIRPLKRMHNRNTVAKKKPKRTTTKRMKSAAVRSRAGDRKHNILQLSRRFRFSGIAFVHKYLH